MEKEEEDRNKRSSNCIDTVSATHFQAQRRHPRPALKVSYEAKKKSHGSDLSSRNSGAQCLKVDNKETSLWNNDWKALIPEMKTLMVVYQCFLHQRSRNCTGGLTPRRGGRGNPTCKCHHGTAVRNP
ncbi:hypothetical protein SESBI_20173 [Sesbania bispinosa]|nr:hypothetical protein SESBI_20173 [Sesbania bispinosa]